MFILSASGHSELIVLFLIIKEMYFSINCKIEIALYFSQWKYICKILDTGQLVLVLFGSLGEKRK